MSDKTTLGKGRTEGDNPSGESPSSSRAGLGIQQLLNPHYGSTGRGTSEAFHQPWGVDLRPGSSRFGQRTGPAPYPPRRPATARRSNDRQVEDDDEYDHDLDDDGDQSFSLNSSRRSSVTDALAELRADIDRRSGGMVYRRPDPENLALTNQRESSQNRSGSNLSFPSTRSLSNTNTPHSRPFNTPRNSNNLLNMTQSKNSGASSASGGNGNANDDGPNHATQSSSSKGKQVADLVENEDADKAPPKPAPTGLRGMICSICMDYITDMTVAKCGHAYCYECIMQALIAKENEARANNQRVIGQCPNCRCPIDRFKQDDLTVVKFKVTKRPRPVESIDLTKDDDEPTSSK